MYGTEINLGEGRVIAKSVAKQILATGDNEVCVMRGEAGVTFERRFGRWEIGVYPGGGHTIRNPNAIVEALNAK